MKKGTDTGLSPISFNPYFEAPIPNVPSFGFRARARGPITAARAAIAMSFGFVCPAMYIAAAAETAVRAYEARIA
jgi:hypothetical protein